MYGLNPAAAAIWELLGQDRDVAGLARVLGARQAGEIVSRDQVETFLRELLELTLVEAVEPAEDSGSAVEPTEDAGPATDPPDRRDLSEPPKILWRETVEQVAASCAFFPATNPLCDQVPFA